MAKFFTSEQIKKIDAFTIANEPVSSVDLMERAALALLGWFKKKFSKETQFVFFVGPGNNGGDGWALARLLYHDGYENIRLFSLKASKNISGDSEINKNRLVEETDIVINEIAKENQFPFIAEEEWIIDALFGSGLTRQLDSISLSLVKYINGLQKSGVVSIDIPSGLFGESNLGNNNEGVICADYTLSFQFPKLAFFFSDNEKYVGKWEILHIGLHPDIIRDEPTPYEYILERDISALIKPRKKFSHKGTYGHALLIAGSYGMMGAAVLAAKAAVRSGAGLVTLHIPKSGYNIIQTAVPESIVSIDESNEIFTGIKSLENYSAIAIGPGLGINSQTLKGLVNVVENAQVPLVIDADGLNILSQNKVLLEKLPENTILTPHPKEFDRLTSEHASHYGRFLDVVKFAQKFKVIVILKGAYTCICSSNGNIWFNTTGNPGMAKGGSGDILTGMIVSLLAQGYMPVEAAKIAVYIHGLAGDMALKKKGYHTLTPTDIIEKLGKAFKIIEK